ncbi:MAG: tetratricopeptide repeat protein, partial [Vicinamibacterales bacterium]
VLDGAAPTTELATTAGGVHVAVQKPSIAVLPFANLGGDAEMEYFSDGVTEEVINAIGQVKGLHVAARTSSFSFKGRNVSIQEVGAALNVTTVLEGSVRRSGQRLRITTQLIDVATGYHTWAERYDRQLDDVFAIQEDIAANIMRKLEVEFRTSALARPSASIDAYDLYLKGRFLVEQRGDGLLKGLELFKQAIAADPSYAPAYAGLSETLTVLAIYAIAPHGTVLPDAGAAAVRALELDGRLAEAHNALAIVSVFRDWDWVKAREEFDRALDLNPNLVQARFWKGLLYHQLSQGNMTEAIEESERAVALDPMGMLPVYSLCMVLVNAGQPAAAIVRCEERLATSPSQFLLYRVLGVAYLCVGRRQDAIDALEKGCEMSRRHTWFVSELGVAYAMNGRREDAERLQEELLARSNLAWISPITLAAIPLALGRVDEAVTRFERAFAEHDPVLLTTTAWPLFSRVRKETRVQRLFARMQVRWTA